MNSIGFKGHYYETRHVSHEYKSKSYKYVDEICSYMQSKKVQKKIAELPEDSVIFAESCSPNYEHIFDILYLPYVESDKKIPQEELDKYAVLEVTADSVKQGDFKKTINNFLDGILSLYSK